MDLQKLSEVTDDYFKEIFQFLSKVTKPEYMSGDEETPIYRFRSSDIEELSQIQTIRK